MDLNRFHANKTLINRCTKASQRIGEISVVVVLSDLLSLVIVVQVRNEPILRILQDIGADGTHLLSSIDESNVQLGALLCNPIIYLT